MTKIALPKPIQNQIPSPCTIGSWTPASWEEFLQISENPDYEKSKFYYYHGSYFLKMGVGSNHAFDNTAVIILLSIFCMLKNIPIKGLTNCSYRKQGLRECQPDISYYIGDRIARAPQGNSIVDLDLVPPPNLAIEIASSSLDLDLGIKRLLYEDMAVGEYWVIDIQNIKIMGFQIHANLGSDRITESQVITGLRLSLLEEALQRSREADNSEMGKWFMSQVQAL